MRIVPLRPVGHRLIAVWPWVPLVLTAVATHPANAQPAMKTRYVVMAWTPAQVGLSVTSAPGQAASHLKPGDRVEASATLCSPAAASPTAATTQTLVQIRPSEGGEARYLAVGGAKPACTTVGAGWAAAKPADSAWYKSLFGWIQPSPVDVRVSASTGGQGRGGTETPSSPSVTDPCGLWPADAGQVRLASGETALSFGTSLPAGSSVLWTRTAPEGSPGIRATVADHRIHLPRQAYQSGDTWQLSAQLPNATAPKLTCALQASVQAARSSPLAGMQETAPSLAADAQVTHAALVAALLADPSQVAWYAWLLSTLPSAQDGAPPSVASQLSEGWWRHAERAVKATAKQP